MPVEERFGEMIPKGGGDPIPLLKKNLTIGRRESCDVVLRFGNVSAYHCELSLESGYWFVKDLNSRNGTRVNGYRVTKRRIDPGDVLSVAKLDYELNYVPAELGAVGPPPDGGDLEDILGQSLMESAGLERKKRHVADGLIGRNRPAKRPRIDATDDESSQTPDATPPSPAESTEGEDATDAET